MPARAISRSTATAERSAATRRRIIEAVRDLLAERAFHDSTMEDVAERAGVSRATLYLHFRSRLELVDSICDVMAENPALIQLRETVRLPDPDQALAETVALSMRFWASEDAVVGELYGVVAVDPAAKDFVDRQYADRRSELGELARNLRRSGRLREGVTEKRALSILLLATSYGSYRELQATGLGEREVAKLLLETARRALFDD
ncbi:MAG TPA: helix-turn-helix domain-containing protein [Thermoleophilaceae bacterium]|jgi:AcrR family transcriptional regulator|nr:helix-turn-helix domain-containing protein [Thermoleophilaceae bacterium]